MLRDGSLSEIPATFSRIDVFCLQCTCAGVLRGSGNQRIGAIVNTVSYYVIGLPIGISLMFIAKLGVIGKPSPRASGSATQWAPERTTGTCWAFQTWLWKFTPLLPCQALFRTDILEQSRMTFLFLSLSCVIQFSLLPSW